VRRALTTLEERLGVVPFLGGESYSIADIATFLWARGVGTFLGKAAEADYPKLMAWVATISSRRAVTRASAAVDEVRAKTTAFDKAGDGAKDRLFGRGHYVA
jgi:GSH-dependent disulfide-bond oxidoreductase